MRKFCVALAMLMMCFSLVACSPSKDNQPPSEQTDNSSNSGTIVQSSEPTVSSIYPEAFVSACSDTNIDVSQVKEWE